MSDPFANASDWSDGRVSPPAAWNATDKAYEFLYNSAAIDLANITYGGTYPTDATTFTAELLAVGHDTVHKVTVIHDGTSTDTTLTLNTPVVVTVPACNSSLVIQGYSDSLGSPGFYYSGVTWTPVPPPPPVYPTCDEPGRVTRAYVSGYQRTRHHATRVSRSETSCLVAEFRGAYPGHSIVSCTWQTNSAYMLALSNPRIVGTECDVDMIAQYAGIGWVKVTAVYDNGDQRVQMFKIAVEDTGWFLGETPPSVGPYTLTAVAA